MLEHVKKLLILPPIVVASLGFIWLQIEAPPQAQDVAETALPVRVLTVAPETFAFTAAGYGRAEAARTWSGVAEVQGRLTVYPDTIQLVALAAQGETVFAIAPRDYVIAVAQAEASVLSAEADLAELDVSEANQSTVLEAEREILDLLTAERDRSAPLVTDGIINQSTLDDQNRALLSQQSVVNNAEAAMSQFAPQRQAAEAALARAEADLERARLDLERAVVTAPFDGRVIERNATLGEYVRAGDVLLTIEDIVYSEVEAAIQPRDLATLIASISDLPRERSREISLASSQVERVLGAFLTAHVAADALTGETVVWPARLTRITGSIDAESGALGVVVAVDDAAFTDAPTERPPLVNGSFVEVVLTGPDIADALFVPRDVVHLDASGQSYVFIADADNRLARRPVAVGPIAGARVLIADGLRPGDRVVLSDVLPAAEGVLLTGVEEPAQ